MEELLIAFAIFALIMGVFIAFLFIGSVCAAHVYKTPENFMRAVEETKRRREERIAAFLGTQTTYNNPSNITDDAFLLFIGEQKLAYGHPESIKSAGEEW